MSVSATAFGPGRVNLIGEHTDYNGGLALAFAIADGVTVRATATGDRTVTAQALDLGENDRFEIAALPPVGVSGWRSFVRGMVWELSRSGIEIPGARMAIAGSIQRGSGLSSSAALEVALCLSLIDLSSQARPSRLKLARLCSRVENEWVGADTGLLDQLTSLYGQAGTALLIDFAGETSITPVPLTLRDGWRLVTVDSGESHSLARSAYNERRREASEAALVLGVTCLSDARDAEISVLPAALGRRARHVLDENERVLEAVAALQDHDLQRLGVLLNASHASLRDLYECSTVAVDQTVEGLLAAGAAGARIVGGGFGGSVLALLGPGVDAPTGAIEVRPSRGARLLDGCS